MKNRIYALDNLRTLMIFLVILVHAGIVYENVLLSSWIVVDPVKNDSIGLVRMYLDLIIMFSLFFISGYFIPASVNKQSPFSLILAKFKRIMIPWFISVFTLVPAYKWLFLYSRGLPQEEWYSYFHFFSREGGDPFWYADNPVMNWLWFLPVLFLFQLAYLVLRKSGLLELRISLQSGIILTFLIGILYGTIISMTDMTGWYHSFFLHFQRERLLVYFLLFLLGSLCYRERVFDWEKWSTKYYILSNALLTFGLTLFTLVALNLFFNLIDPARDFYFVSPTVDRIAYYTFLMLAMLSFLHVLLFSFHKSLNRAGRLMRTLNQNAYYVYIIHLIVLGLIAMPMTKLAWPAFVKFPILAILSFVASNLLVSAVRYLWQLLSGTKNEVLRQ